VLATALFFSTRRRRRTEQRKLNAACDTANTAQPTLTAEQMASATKRRVHMLHLLVKRLTAASLPPASVPEMQALLLSNGHTPEHADSIFVMNELRCSPAVEFTKGAMKLAATPAARCSFQVSEAMPSTHIWQSKEELQLYFQQAIVAMSEVTGVNGISVAYELQRSLGSLVDAMLALVSSTSSPHTSACMPASECMLSVADCSDTVLTCPSCSFAVCSACHMDSVLNTARFPMLDDNPTRQRFEHEGMQQSMEFFCCTSPSCGVLLPPHFWQTFMQGVAVPSGELPDTILSRCARLVSRVSRHHVHPLILSCECSKFYWQPTPQQPVLQSPPIILHCHCLPCTWCILTSALLHALC
jgi:hypothetical protein